MEENSKWGIETDRGEERGGCEGMKRVEEEKGSK